MVAHYPRVERLRAFDDLRNDVPRHTEHAVKWAVVVGQQVEQDEAGELRQRTHRQFQQSRVGVDHRRPKYNYSGQKLQKEPPVNGIRANTEK